MEVAVNINNNSYCNSCFCSTNANAEQSEEETFHLSGEQQAVECRKVDINRVENQLNRNQHCNQVAAGNKPEHTYKNNSAESTKKYSTGIISYYSFLEITIPPIMQASKNTEINSNGSTY